MFFTIGTISASDNVTDEINSVKDNYEQLNTHVEEPTIQEKLENNHDNNSSFSNDNVLESTDSSELIISNSDYNDNILENDYEDSYTKTSGYDGEFVVKNFKMKYGSGLSVHVWLKDRYDDLLLLGDNAITLHWNDSTETKLIESAVWDSYDLEEFDVNLDNLDEESYWTYDGEFCVWRGYFTYIAKPIGNYSVTAVCNDRYYNIEPATFSVNIIKGTVKLTPKVYHSASGDYAILKCNVVNSYDQRVFEGTVTFKINGQSYKVKVKNGVATKKVKLTKAKVYEYTATFNDDNYDSKSASSKIYVYKTSKKARTFKIGKYKVVVPLAKYKKLIDAKNTNKITYYHLYTGKKITQKVKIDGKWKTKKNVKVYIDIEYGGKTGSQGSLPNKYSICLETYYQSPVSDDCKPWLSGYKLKSLISDF